MLVSYIFLNIDLSNIFKFDSDSPRRFTLFASELMGWEELIIFSPLLCDFKDRGILFQVSQWKRGHNANDFNF